MNPANNSNRCLTHILPSRRLNNTNNNTNTVQPLHQRRNSTGSNSIDLAPTYPHAKAINDINIDNTITNNTNSEEQFNHSPLLLTSPKFCADSIKLHQFPQESPPHLTSDNTIGKGDFRWSVDEANDYELHGIEVNSPLYNPTIKSLNENNEFEESLNYFNDNEAASSDGSEEEFDSSPIFEFEEEIVKNSMASTRDSSAANLSMNNNEINLDLFSFARSHLKAQCKQYEQRSNSTASTETDSLDSNHNIHNNNYTRAEKFDFTPRPHSTSNFTSPTNRYIYSNHSSGLNSSTTRSSPITIPTPTSSTSKNNSPHTNYRTTSAAALVATPKFLKYAKSELLPTRRLKVHQSSALGLAANSATKNINNRSTTIPPQQHSLLFHLEL